MHVQYCRVLYTWPALRWSMRYRCWRRDTQSWHDAAGIRIFGEYACMPAQHRGFRSSPRTSSYVLTFRLPMGCSPAWPRYGGRPASWYLDRAFTWWMIRSSSFRRALHLVTDISTLRGLALRRLVGAPSLFRDGSTPGFWLHTCLSEKYFNWLSSNVVSHILVLALFFWVEYCFRFFLSYLIHACIYFNFFTSQLIN
jgi:hypothetical protein